MSVLTSYTAFVSPNSSVYTVIRSVPVTSKDCKIQAVMIERGQLPVGVGITFTATTTNGTAANHRIGVLGIGSNGAVKLISASDGGLGFVRATGAISFGTATTTPTTSEDATHAVLVPLGKNTVDVVGFLIFTYYSSAASGSITITYPADTAPQDILAALKNTASISGMTASPYDGFTHPAFAVTLT